MKIKPIPLFVAGALFGASILPAQASNEAMMDLLKVLHQKGTITDSDYELLTNAAKADKEAGDAVAMKADKAAKTASTSGASWADRIKIKGDMRFRHETENVDKGAGSSRTNEEDRFRVRARVGAYAQVNETTKAGIRIVSTLGSATSTNQSLENDFETIDASLDLAYIDWAPAALGGSTHLIVGKMKQPWVKVNDMIWDGDTNPEGLALKSKYDMGGFTLTPSVGYYTLASQGNDSVSRDSHLIHAQLAAKVSKTTKFGVSFYNYQNETPTAFSNEAGNVTPAERFVNSTVFLETEKGFINEEERIIEVFGQTAVPTLPVTVYGNWAHNTNADQPGDDDNAWSLGAKAKIDDFKFTYEYRDLGVNAVNDNFDNSDFLNNSKGSIIKAAYQIDKNFTAQASYYTSETNVRNSDEEVDLLHLDLKVKF